MRQGKWFPAIPVWSGTERGELEIGMTPKTIVIYVNVKDNNGLDDWLLRTPCFNLYRSNHPPDGELIFAGDYPSLLFFWPLRCKRRSLKGNDDQDEDTS